MGELLRNGQAATDYIQAFASRAPNLAAGEIADLRIWSQRYDAIGLEIDGLRLREYRIRADLGTLSDAGTAASRGARIDAIEDCLGAPLAAEGAVLEQRIAAHRAESASLIAYFSGLDPLSATTEAVIGGHRNVRLENNGTTVFNGNGNGNGNGAVPVFQVGGGALCQIPASPFEFGPLVIYQHVGGISGATTGPVPVSSDVEGTGDLVVVGVLRTLFEF